MMLIIAFIIAILLLLNVMKSSGYLLDISTAIQSYIENIERSTFTAAGINIVSLTTSSDFYILFNNLAITSWAQHIQNIKSITFIGIPGDEKEFWDNMAIHYPQFPTDQFPGTHDSSRVDRALPRVHWVN